MANDTNDTDSRTASVREIIERLDEIDRLSESTNFNGRTMLDGSVDKIVVQMGPDETNASVLDISRALTDCHVESLNSLLPGNLNPDALKLDTGDIIIPKEEVQDDGSVVTKYYYEKDGTEYTGNTTGLETAYDPTNENCRAYMAKIQAAIADLSTRRGLLGAYENRMDSSFDSMSTRIESLETAKSVYTDTDIAESATAMSTQQIMQQYNVAILANTNTFPQLALSLIGG
jgi:flagellin